MHLPTNAPDGSYEKLLVGIDTDSNVSQLISYVLQPLGKKLDKEMKELKQLVSPKSTNNAQQGGRRARKNKTRKNKNRK